MAKNHSLKVRLGRSAALSACAGVLLLGLGPSAAHATPSYGYAELNFQNFDLSGVVGNPSVTSITDTVLMTDGATYPGYAPGGNSQYGNLTNGVDALQATSGPGPFPGENIFAPSMTTSSGTRGDGLITGAIATGATSNLVSEGRLTVGPASAGSNAGSSTTITATFTTTQNTTVGLTFGAEAVLNSIVGTLGDNATALSTATFSIQDLNTGNYLSICGGITGGTSTCTIAGANKGAATVAPDALNNTVGTNTPLNPDFFDSGLSSYAYTASLVGGDQYRIVLGDSTQEILSTVPEPLSISLLGVGLVGLGLVRRRRRQV